MKREPRLQFSDADLAEPKLEKTIKRVKKLRPRRIRRRRKSPRKPWSNRSVALILPPAR